MRFACAVTAVVLGALAPINTAAADAPERREVGDIIMENLPSSIRYDGRAVFDLLGPGFTLICFAETDTSVWVREAAARGVPCDILTLHEAAVRAIYERDFLLVRPDQHVCWRGNEMPENTGVIWDKVTGQK